MKIVSKIMAALALIGVGVTPIAASAQEMQTAQYSVSYQQLTPEMTVSMVEPAMGMAVLPEEAMMLARDGCFIGPIQTSRELYDWAERKNIAPCTEDFYSKVDKYVGQESMVSFRVTRVADGYMHCPLAKAINLGNNRQACVTYPFNPAFNVQGQVGKYADVNWAEGGEAQRARIFTSLAGALIQGPLTAATGQLLAPSCSGNRCGGSNVYNLVEGATAVSGSTATAATENDIGISFGNCSTGTCSAPVAEPVHSVNPSNGSGQ